ncbi:hypothetical protein Sinac_5183 [Singulisphaera acidiphila DSM 18658]|uniref:Uncharacterized protein n=1 Tax=Singulisphaera acidiphila (strain ATCC BAA-1392 / DSM 18658 / VKM B-2454 / MOB10) TaxID=886293 RepID=L0DKH2_SINAD|nr:hypothetical protein Sinac_5183 [Singulisphaera acidiphila DSM 18658]
MPGKLRYRCDRRWRLSRNRGKPGNRSNRHARTAIMVLNRLNPIQNSTKDLILTVESLARSVSAVRPNVARRRRPGTGIAIDHEIPPELRRFRQRALRKEQTGEGGGEGGVEMKREVRCEDQPRKRNALIPNLLTIG